MSAIEELGAKVSRTFVSRRLDSDNIQLSSGELTRLDITLPKSSGMSVSFRKESWGDSLVKVFKKELQTGDAEFDKAVYISTDTPDTVKTFLTSEMRAAVGLTIETGGTLEIDGASVISHTVGKSEDDDQWVVQIIGALLA